MTDVIPGIAGVAGNGTADDKPAIDAIIAASDTIEFLPGRYKIASSQTWPAGKVYIVRRGAYIEPAAGTTLEILGEFWAGAYKIFGTSAAGVDVAGTVQGMQHVKPEWWHCHRDGVRDDAPAFQKAIFCGQNFGGPPEGGRLRFEMQRGCYAINSTIRFTLDGNRAWEVFGASAATTGSSTIIKTLSTFDGDVAMQIDGNNGGDTSTDCYFHDFSVQNDRAGSGPANGLVVGAPAAHTLRGFGAYSLFENIVVRDFAIACLIRNVAEMKFSRMWLHCGGRPSGSSSNALLVTAHASFVTSDLIFEHCIFEGRNHGTISGSRGVRLTDNGNNSAVVAGIRFLQCTWYGGDAQLQLSTSGANSTIADIFIGEGCQFEGPTGTTDMIVATPTGAGSTMRNVRITGVYGSGFGFSRHISASTSPGTTIRDWGIYNNFLANADRESIVLDGRSGTVRGCKIVGNEIYGVTPNNRGNAAIFIGNGTAITVNSNTMSDGSTRANLVQFNSGGDYVTAVGNNSGGHVTGIVADRGTATHANVEFNV